MDGAMMESLSISEPPQVTEQMVRDAIDAAVGLDSAAREAAEAALSAWEQNAAPGFVSSLLHIVQRADAPQPKRMLAAIVAKNSIGSSWRKRMGTKEWSNVPADEKAFVRSAVEALLISEPSESIASHVGLLIANIACFDFPQEWPGLLAMLVQACDWENGSVAIAAKQRILRTLKRVVMSLASQRPSINTAEQAAAGASLQALISERLAQVKNMHVQAVQPFGHARRQFMTHMQAVEAGAGDVNVLAQRIKAAKTLLRVLASMINMMPSITEPVETQQEVTKLYGSILAMAPKILLLHPSLFVRMGECALAGMDQHALSFRVYLRQFIDLFVDAMLQMPVDRDSLQAAPQALMIVTRFLARAMLCPLYQSARLARLQPQSEWAGKASAAAQAEAIVSECFGPERCTLIVRALITKYLVLTPQELEEWQESPEQAALNDSIGLLESVEIGEADSPRPCGHALFLCMVVRQPQVISDVILAFAEELQGQQPPTEETWILRDACYHAIGAMAPRLKGKLDFNQWYNTELRVHLEGPIDGGTLLQRVLQARSLWLISQFAANDWSDVTKHHAVESILRMMRSTDIKLGLVATRVLYLLIVSRRANILGPDGGCSSARPQTVTDSIKDSEAGKDAPNTVHPGIYGQLAGAVLEGCFNLLQRLSEVDNVIAVLRLFAIYLIHAGDALIPHLDTITSALPKAWHTIEGHGVAAGTRGHAVMLTVVASLLRRLKMHALRHEALASVVMQLLHFVTDPESRAAGREDLLDDGLTLWYSALRSYDKVGPELMGLLDRLPGILASNCEPCKGLLLLEAYMLLGGDQFVATYGAECAGTVAQILLNADRSRTQKELVLAASVADTFIQLNAALMARALHPALLHMFRAIVLGHVSGLLLSTFCATIARLLLVDANVLESLAQGNLELQIAFLERLLQPYVRPRSKVLLVARAGGLLSDCRREIKLVTLAFCALLGAGKHIAWERLQRGVMQLLEIAHQLQPSNVAGLERNVDVSELAQRDGYLTAMQTSLLIRDPASAFNEPVSDVAKRAVAFCLQQKGAQWLQQFGIHDLAPAQQQLLFAGSN